MKAMIFSDFITSKNSALSLLGIMFIIALFISIFTGTLYGSIGACAAMVPFMYLFSISAYDEQNGWERYRLTLPITRRQVAYGRYASMLVICACAFVLAVAIGYLLGIVAGLLPAQIVPEGLRLSEANALEVVQVALLTQVVILLVATLTLPFLLRYGMTKATRIAPMVLIFAICGFVVLLGNTPIADNLEALVGQPGGMGMGMLTLIVLAIVIVLYSLSALIAARLYEHREP